MELTEFYCRETQKLIRQKKLRVIEFHVFPHCTVHTEIYSHSIWEKICESNVFIKGIAKYVRR